jgi:hypothetical protein
LYRIEEIRDSGISGKDGKGSGAKGSGKGYEEGYGLLSTT